MELKCKVLHCWPVDKFHLDTNFHTWLIIWVLHGVTSTLIWLYECKRSFFFKRSLFREKKKNILQAHILLHPRGACVLSHYLLLRLSYSPPLLYFWLFQCSHLLSILRLSAVFFCLYLSYPSAPRFCLLFEALLMSRVWKYVWCNRQMKCFLWWTHSRLQGAALKFDTLISEASVAAESRSSEIFSSVAVFPLSLTRTSLRIYLLSHVL